MNVEPQSLVFVLVGFLQIIAIGLIGWALLKIIELLDRVGHLEGKFDAFPMQQVTHNRHRIEQLERQSETTILRVNRIEKVCEKHHGA